MVCQIKHPVKALTFQIISLVLILSFVSVSFAERPEQRIDTYIRLKPEQKEFKIDLLIDSLTEQQKERIIRSIISVADEEALARLIYGEDRQNSLYERSAVIWVVYNRMDISKKPISELINFMDFGGYTDNGNVYKWARDLVRDVTLRYALEKMGYEDVGRTIPKQYVYFEAQQGKHIFKTKKNIGESDNIWWDWSLPQPYGDK